MFFAQAGVVGFLLILTLSSALSSPSSAKKPKASKAKSTPGKKGTPKKLKSGLGTVDTPDGRRSRRIASRRE